MGDKTFNKAKGKVAYYTEQVGTGGARLGILLLINNGTFTVQGDDPIIDHATVAALLGANQEATTSNSPSGSGVSNYIRKYITAYNITTGAYNDINNTTNAATADFPDVLWSALGGAFNNAIGALIVYFDPTGSSADSACIPLTKHDFSVTPDGSDISALVSGFWKAIDA